MTCIDTVLLDRHQAKVDSEDRREAHAEALEIMAGQIAFITLRSNQASWYKLHDFGELPLIPDDAFCDAIKNDDEVTDTFEALMKDASPAAEAFHKALASYIAKHHWRDIVGSRANDV